MHAGAEWNGLNPANTWPRRARSLLYGCNDMSAGKPNMFVMAAELLMHPMYLVQVRCHLCRCIDWLMV